MQSSQNGWVYFVGHFESDSWLVFLKRFNDSFLFFFSEVDSGDDLDILLFVENFAVIKIGIDCLLEFCQPSCFYEGVDEV